MKCRCAGIRMPWCYIVLRNGSNCKLFEGTTFGLHAFQLHCAFLSPSQEIRNKFRFPKRHTLKITTTFENNWFTKVTIELTIHPICTIWWAEQLMNYIKHTAITRICNFIVWHGLATCLCLLLFSNICKKAEAHSETTSSTLLRGHLEGHVAHVNHSLDWLPLGSKTGWSQDLPLSGKYLFVLVLGLSFGRCSTSILVTSTLWLSSGAAAACVVWCRQPVLTSPLSSFPHFEQPSFQASSVFHCFPLVELLEPWQQTAFARYLIMMTLTRVIANNHHGCTEIATKAPQQGAMVVP